MFENVCERQQDQSSGVLSHLKYDACCFEQLLMRYIYNSRNTCDVHSKTKKKVEKSEYHRTYVSEKMRV